MASAPSIQSIRRAMSSRYSRQKVTKRQGIIWREDGFAVMQSVLKPGEQGMVSVSHFTISEKDADRFNAGHMFNPGGGMYDVDPGKYVRLHVGGNKTEHVMMSDTNMERRSNWQVKDNAHGRVLIAGLGIGMILHPILDPTRAIISRRAGEALQAVEHVTVVELNQDVIDLVAPSLERYGDRVTIVKADINSFDPGKEKYDTVYFDIWRRITEDNLPEIASLHQRWKSRLNRSGELKPWMSSWMVEHLRSQRRESSSRFW